MPNSIDENRDIRDTEKRNDNEPRKDTIGVISPDDQDRPEDRRADIPVSVKASIGKKRPASGDGANATSKDSDGGSPKDGKDEKKPRERKGRGKKGKSKLRLFLSGYLNIMLHGRRLDRVLSWAAVLAAIVLLVVIPAYNASPYSEKSVDTGQFVEELKNGNVSELHLSLSGDSASGTYRNPVEGVTKFTTTTPERSETFVKMYVEGKNVKYDYSKPNAIVSTLTSLVVYCTPTLIILGAVIYLYKDGGLGGIVGGGEDPDVSVMRSDTTFEDVCGIPEAIEEVSEILAFLKDPEKYREAGAKVPKGILLTGDPGCGKTLLARAIAGEADVPFISQSGSDFVELFVGMGARRVRKLFETARECQPCIVFIDEIDAIGGNRNNVSSDGGGDEKIQTINALLSEMDGFTKNDSIIVMAATNREAALDPALTRPGRFDRIVSVDAPAKDGRREILEHYAIGRPFAAQVDFEELAAHTYGFSGAQLEGVMNEAATLAARRAMADGTHPRITQADLEEGIARVMSGPAMRSRKMSDEEKRQVSFHEAGHAVVQYVLPECDNVQKISIIGRNMRNGGGQALGYVQTYSEEDRYVTTAETCRAELASLLAGRCAENMFCGMESAGCSDDLKRASDLAYRMVDEFAFDMAPKALGPDGKSGCPDPLSRDRMLRTRVSRRGLAQSSESRLQAIDETVEHELHSQMEVAYRILDENRDKVMAIVSELAEREEISASRIREIMGDGGQDGPDGGGSGDGGTRQRMTGTQWDSAWLGTMGDGRSVPEATSDDTATDSEFASMYNDEDGASDGAGR